MHPLGKEIFQFKEGDRMEKSKALSGKLYITVDGRQALWISVGPDGKVTRHLTQQQEDPLLRSLTERIQKAACAYYTMFPERWNHEKAVAALPYLPNVKTDM